MSKTTSMAGALAAVLLALGGCGYSLAGRGDFLPAHVKTIGIPTFQNLTDGVGLGELLTEKVVTEFNSRGRYTITPDATGADALLSGVVVAFVVSPAVLQGGQQEDVAAGGQASRYNVVVRVRVDFKDLIDDKSLWSDNNFTFREEYEIGEDPEQYFDQGSLALERLGEEFAKTLVSRILEAF
jgi:hypothetical protein